jgi:DNA-binding CsgD family transcriptional regulator
VATEVGSVAAAGVALNLHGVMMLTRPTRDVLAYEADAIARFSRRGMAHAAEMMRKERTQTLVFAGWPVEATREADALLEGPLDPRRRTFTLARRAEALAILGRFDEATSAAAAAIADASPEVGGRGDAHVAAADVAFWSGRLDHAIEHAEAALAIPVHYRGNYLLPALTLAWASVELGRPLPAVPDAPASWMRDGVTAEVVGLRALVDGRPADALVAFEAGASAWTDRHAPRELVCRWAAGDVARLASREVAVARLTLVLEAAEAMGFEPLAARVRRSLRLAGARVPRRSAAEVSGESLLTARERELLTLAAAGLSNIEIARRMGLGRPTVARILSNAMRKLGTDSRAGAVARLEASAPGQGAPA